MQVEAEHPVLITNPEKLLWPEAGVTKAQYMQYLVNVAPWLLAHLRDRPITMIRFPHGIHGHSFYQKDAPQGAPEWVRTVPLWSDDRGEYIHPVVVDSVATLLWLANLACLEMHVGFATLQRPMTPTSIAFDLDPTVPGFEPVREVAMALHEVLEGLGLPHVPKTSGATGVQVFIPLANLDNGAGHSYEETRLFTAAVATYLEQKLPRIVTLERLKKHRGDKVYVDYLQHGHHRTLIAPYSARATVHATVSTPLTWSELAGGAVPEQFTVHNVPSRLRKIGDLMNVGPGVRLEQITSVLKDAKAICALR
ncbi:non-homologous end-joining DNA ligase [Alicyclobacillus cycloheptanicus]|uniref:Bifunctional non-homologous end joining protein LigD n=1 Tax=Alicyclobacillus cycloheptanicus TaxID=1457 RepID=A0ABT9XE48_9BACL|nr:non-homologous end-joining DNA ligase [Alicyclobacillus cycloheptanicus]MDQ0188574.1 bifunctional non-homologous end joining protein LigD [Alicyclobacillus cycloheptanicus]WDM01255.1 non-homologous end-joining DNA ligase [Alicyclobacillus cycloheptanicus]